MDERHREWLPATGGRREWTSRRARELRRQSTDSEAILWEQLRDRRLHGLKFRRQQPVGPFVVDFFCAAASLIVEIDGAAHDDQQEYDQERQAQLEGAGYRVFRIPAERVVNHLDDVLTQIKAFISEK